MKAFKKLTTDEAFSRNEIEANKKMCLASAFMSVAMSVTLVLYIFHVFPLHNYTPVYIALPVLIVFLLLPMACYRTSITQYWVFKYAIFAVFLTSVGILNIILPKHALIAYALLIVLSVRYYNPKMSLWMYVTCMITMLICLYMGMFFGEYDPNLLGPGEVVFDEAQGAWIIFQPDKPSERYRMLQEMIQKGDNRFVAVLAYYYFSRGLTLTLVYVAAHVISKSTHTMLTNEVKAQESRARIATELSIAEEIQRSLLPSPTYQDKQVEIVAQLKPAREVGGDFYDFAKIDETHIGILIGDVSGKGIPAAMFMMKTLTSFRACYSSSSSPAETMAKVNKLIFAGNSADMFVTCFFGIVDTEDGTMRFANAGHTPPILKRGDKAIPLPCHKGFVMGGMEETVVVDQIFHFKKGDSLLLYTDGVTEAMNPQSEIYGEKRLLQFISSINSVTAMEECLLLEDDINAFVSGAEQSDDLTYLLFVYQGETIFVASKLFPADLSALPDAEAFVRENAEQANIEKKIIDAYLIALDEIYSNIVKYGQLPQGAQIFVRCTYRPEKDLVAVTVVDTGVEFDPRTYQATTVDQRDDAAPAGGLGWLMIRNLMDEIIYHRINGKNVVSIVKSLKKN